MAKKPIINLPVGTLVWPKLNEVDVYQPVDKKGRPNGAEKRRYITYVRYEPKVLVEVKKQLADYAAKLLPDVDSPKLPFRKDKKTGEELLVATSGEKYRPMILDGKRQEIPVSVIVGGGTEARAEVTVNAYEGFGGGMNLYLNGIQIKKLVRGGKRELGFEEMEDGFVYEGTEEDAEIKDHNESEDEGSYSF